MSMDSGLGPRSSTQLGQRGCISCLAVDSSLHQRHCAPWRVGARGRRSLCLGDRVVYPGSKHSTGQQSVPEGGCRTDGGQWCKMGMSRWGVTEVRATTRSLLADRARRVWGGCLERLAGKSEGQGRHTVARNGKADSAPATSQDGPPSRVKLSCRHWVHHPYWLGPTQSTRRLTSPTRRSSLSSLSNLATSTSGEWRGGGGLDSVVSSANVEWSTSGQGCGCRGDGRGE